MSGDEQNAMVPVGSSARGSRPGGRPATAGRGPGSTEDGDGAGSVEWTPPEAPPVVLFVVTALAATALTLVDLGREAPLVQSLRLGMALVALVTASIARRRPTLALQLLLGAALLALFVFRLAGGAGYWLALVPMVAGFYGGLRTGVGWCAATCVGVLLGPYLDPLVADEVSSAMGRRVVEEVFFVLLMLIFPALADRRRRRELDHLAVTSAALSRANQRLDRAGKQEREARESSERIARAHLALLARLSHEIRTPLSAIQGLVELLKTEPLPVQAKEAVVSIDASTRGLRGLVNDMLDLARIEAGKLVVERIAFDPRSLLEDTVDLYVGAANARGIELMQTADPRVPDQIFGDPTRIAQVLGNLVNNALRFTERGHVAIALTPDGDSLFLTVTDTGVGMTDEQLAVVFRPFEQGGVAVHRQAGGSGLGLTLVDELTRAMGATISVTSEPGVGTRFALRFACEPVHDDASKARVSVLPVRAGARVLVVEPNALVRAAAVASAEAAGFQAYGAGDFAEAARQVAKHAPKVVVVGAEVGADVAALADRLAAQAPRLPRVLAVSLGQSELASAMIESGRYRGLTMRPLRRSRVSSVVEEAIEGELDPASTAPRVLVVDDDPINRRLTAELTRRAGAEVITAHDGGTAIARATDGDVDLVLLDLHLPDMEGVDVAKAVRTTVAPARRPRLVALTASDLSADRKRCAEAGMDGYLVRPIAIGTLQHLVEEAHRRRRRRSGRRSSSMSIEAVSAEVSPLRIPALRELEALLGPDESRALIEEYRSNTAKLLRELDVALAKQDRVSAHRSVHTIASSSKAVGAERASTFARALEEHLLAVGDEEALDVDIGPLAESLQRADEALRAWCEQPPPRRDPSPRSSPKVGGQPEAP